MKTKAAVTDASNIRSGLDRVGSAVPSRGWWLAGAFTLVVALWTLVPWRPPSVSADAPYLDSSWMVVLHLAFVDGLTFGKDVVFTYGPWGFAATRIYVPGTFGWLLVWWIVLAASLWYGAFAVAVATVRSPVWAALWMSALLLLVSLGNEAPFIAVVALFVVAAAGYSRSRHLTGATVLLSVILAWLGLVKFTYFGLGIAVVGIVTAWLLVTRHRFGPALPVYLAAWLILWLAAGQPVVGVPDYVINGLSVAVGYTPAMGLWSNNGLVVVAFAAVVLTLVLVLLLERVSGRRFPVMTCAFGLTLYVVFKAGFVRQDDWHTPIGLLGIAVVALVAAPLFTCSGLSDRRRAAFTATAVATAAGLWAISPVPGPAAHLAAMVRSTDDTLAFFVRPSKAADSRRDGWSSALAEIRRKVPVPDIKGTADLYPDDQLVLVANGLRRRSRPVFQSYFAYTPRLTALNEAELAGEDRPRTIFVDLAPIDDHWPTSEDGPSLVRILSDYGLRLRTGSYLVFERRTRAGYRLEQLGEVRTHLDSSVPVPSITAGPVWVTIAVPRTFIGRVEDLALRPSLLVIDARLADGRRVVHRLVPPVASSGFLLSPYVANRGAFAAMTTRSWRRSLAGSAVKTITVRAEHDRFHGYARDVDVSFARILLPSR